MRTSGEEGGGGGEGVRERAHLSIFKHVCCALSPKIENIASKHPSQRQLQAFASVLNFIKIPDSTAASLKKEIAVLN